MFEKDGVRLRVQKIVSPTLLFLPRHESILFLIFVLILCWIVCFFVGPVPSTVDVKRLQLVIRNISTL